MSIDWSTAPEGFPIWLEDIRPSRRSGDSEDRSSWAKDGEGEYTLSGATSGWWAKSREGHDFIAHQKPAQWTGEGLPPVGMVCEMRRTDYVDVDWQRIEFLCAGSKKAFFRDQEGHEWSRPLSDLKFRSIRTPEQIAADEREKAIADMVYGGCGCDQSDGTTTAFVICGLLYDAGYRKQVAP